ncbi:hypothetical protein [Acidithiobacillus sulfurivorans]|uniref:Conjugal transfer protein TrbI n=1 Tax=Acidithiobacillus sulfurivorans TaxID=1958756 RepID=A0ABS6A1E7_9PROT|nr:hypothetical protein [Acidithiobacillus sulfurivorans]MBU2761091.1 hypothetical protein [Acidithiobacillus sulfurivorans]
MTDPTQTPMGEGPGITTPTVKGPIRQNASELAAHLRRTPIALGVILLVTCVIGVGYVAVDMFSGSGGSTPRPKLDTGHQAPVFRVPQKVSKIQAPTAPATSPSQAASPSLGAKTASTGNALTGSTFLMNHFSSCKR